MIQTIIFDLGGVYFTDGTKRAIKVISSRYGVPERKVKGILRGTLGTRYRAGEVTADKFWREAEKCWGINVKSGELARIWLEGYKPIAKVAGIIDRLNASGYEVAFLSDNVKERADYLEKKYKFLKRFKDGIFSHIAHVRKPSLKIYKMVLEKVLHPAEECVYIDDKLKFLKPAKKLGMKITIFKNASQLERELKKIGLKF